MANDSSGGPTDEAVEGSWSPRRSKATAGKPKGKSSPDPDALAEEIEKTREELADTLDAIAEKVSPKRVVTRTKKKVGDAVKDGAAEAADSVKSSAAAAADAVKGGVAQVKGKASADSTGDLAGSPLPPAAPDGPAPSPLSEQSESLPGAQVPLEPAPTPGALADAAQVSAEPAGAEVYAPPPSLPPAPSRLPALAGAGAALLLLLLVMKRRRR